MKWYEKDNHKVPTRLLKMSNAKFEKAKKKAIAKAMSKRKPHERKEYSEPIGDRRIKIYW